MSKKWELTALGFFDHVLQEARDARLGPRGTAEHVCACFKEHLRKYESKGAGAALILHGDDLFFASVGHVPDPEDQ